MEEEDEEEGAEGWGRRVNRMSAARESRRVVKKGGNEGSKEPAPRTLPPRFGRVSLFRGGNERRRVLRETKVPRESAGEAARKHKLAVHRDRPKFVLVML